MPENPPGRSRGSWRGEPSRRDRGAGGPSTSRYQFTKDKAAPRARRATTRRSRIVKGLAGLLACLAAIAGLIWLLLPPAPMRLVLVGAGYAENLSVPHNAWGLNALAGLKAIADRAVLRGPLLSGRRLIKLHAPGDGQPYLLAGADGDEAWKRFDALLRRRGGEPVLFLFLALHGGSKDGRPFVLPEGAHPGSKPLVMSRVLATLGKLPPKQHKVLVLDCTTMPEDWSLGLLRNEFAAGMKALLETDAGKISNLWVLSSSMPGERSWIDQRESRRSVFAQAVIEGLAGAKAKGDTAETVTLGGLARVVRERVSGADGRRTSQTPHLWASAATVGLHKGRRPTEEQIVKAASGVELVRTVATIERPAQPAAIAPRSRKFWAELAGLLRSESPHAYAPLQWRRYRELLVRREQLERAGYYGTTAALGLGSETAELDEALARLPDEIRRARRPDSPTPKGSLTGTLGMPAAAGILAPRRGRRSHELDRPILGLLHADEAKFPTTWADLVKRSRDELPEVGVLGRVLELLADPLSGELTLNRKNLEWSARLADRVEPAPAEIQFLRILARAGNLSAEGQAVPDETLRLALEVRLAAERAAVAAAADGGYSYSEQIEPWIRDALRGADAERLRGEDLLYATAPEDHALAGTALAAAKARYAEIAARAERLRTAMDARDRAYADLPSYSRWAARRAGVVSNLPPDVVASQDEELAAHEGLWREVHDLADALESREPRREGEVVAKGERVRRGLDAAASRFLAEAKAEGRTVEPWEDELARDVPIADRDAFAPIAAAATDGRRDPVGVGLETLPQRRRRHVASQARMVLACYGPSLINAAASIAPLAADGGVPGASSEAPSIPEGETWRDLVDRSVHLGRVVKEPPAGGATAKEQAPEGSKRSRGVDPPPDAPDASGRNDAQELDALCKVLSRRLLGLPGLLKRTSATKFVPDQERPAARLVNADRLARLIDAGQRREGAPALLGGKPDVDPVRRCRAWRLYAFLLQQAGRAWSDHYWSVATGPASPVSGPDPYYRVAGLAYLDDAEALARGTLGLRAQESATATTARELRERLGRPGGLKLGLEPGSTRDWTSEPSLSLRYRLVPDAEQGVPDGARPVVWTGPREPVGEIEIAPGVIGDRGDDAPGGRAVLTLAADRGEFPSYPVTLVSPGQERRERGSHARPGVKPVSLGIGGFFRGHHFGETTKLLLHERPEFVRYEPPAPDPAIAVRMDGAGGGFGGNDSALAVVFDNSESMEFYESVDSKNSRRSKLDAAAATLGNALNQLASGTYVKIGTFSKDHPWENWVPGSRDIPNLIRGPGFYLGGTPLARNIIAAADELSRVQRPRKSLLVLTDGAEYVPGTDPIKEIGRLADHLRSKTSGMSVNVVLYRTNVELNSRFASSFKHLNEPTQRTFADVNDEIRDCAAAEEVAIEQFKFLGTLNPPGSLVAAREEKELGRRLEESLRRERRFTVRPSRAEAGAYAVGSMNSADVAATLGPGESQVVFNDPSLPSPKVSLKAGDRMLVDVLRKGDGSYWTRRGQLNLGGPRPSAFGHQPWILSWRTEKPAQGGLRLLAAIQQRESEKMEAVLRQATPQVAWFELEPDGYAAGPGPRPLAVEWRRDYTKAGPAWVVSVPEWRGPDRPGGVDDRLRLKVWFDPASLEGPHATLRPGEHEATVRGKPVRLEVVGENHHVGDNAPRRAIGKRPCLVVRIRHDPADPVWPVVKFANPPANQEHRYYEKAGVYTVLCWDVDAGQIEGAVTEVQLHSVIEWKRRMEARKSAMDLPSEVAVPAS